MAMSARDLTKHFHYERKRQPRGDSRITSTKWSRGHDILSRSHELICGGHDKTSLSEPNISPPVAVNASFDFSEIIYSELLPVRSEFLHFEILNIEFDVPKFFFILKTWCCIFKNWIFAVK